VIEIDEASPAEASDAISNPLYFIVAASREAAALAATPGALSVLSDRDDWVHRDYVKVMGMMEAAVRNGDKLAAELRDRNLSLIALQKDLGLVSGDLTRRLVEIADLNREISQRDRAMTEKDIELTRRRGIRWWLKLPFIRLRDFFRS
jgi:hypothetical protein